MKNGKNFISAKEILGTYERKFIKKKLYSKLQRGVYAKKNLKGAMLNKDNIYCVFPLQKNQLAATNLRLKVP